MDVAGAWCVCSVQVVVWFMRFIIVGSYVFQLINFYILNLFAFSVFFLVLSSCVCLLWFGCVLVLLLWTDLFTSKVLLYMFIAELDYSR